MAQGRLDAPRPGPALIIEVAASGCCAIAAIVRGLHAQLTLGHWHLLAGGAVWLVLSALLGAAVLLWWDRLGSYGRLFLRGLARVLGVAALIALAILAIMAIGEVAGDLGGGGGGHAGGGGDCGGGHGGGGDCQGGRGSSGGGLDGVDIGDRRRRWRLAPATRAELHAALWPLGSALIGGVLVGFAVAALPLGTGLVSDVVGLAGLTVGVALGGLAGYRVAQGRIRRLHRALELQPPDARGFDHSLS